MPLPNATNVVRVEMRYQCEGERVENVFHVHGTSAWDTGSLGDLGLAFFDWWNDNLKNIQSTQTTLREIYLLDLTTSPGLEYTFVTGLPGGGLDSAAAIANNVTACISWRTGFAGRSQRGRTYHIGMTKNYTDNSLMTSSFVSQALDTYNALIPLVQASSNDPELVVLSYYHNNAVRPTPTWEPILTATLVDNVVDSQRRRLPGRGE